MAEFNPFQSFSDNIKNYVDEQVKSSNRSEGDVATIVREYLNNNPVEADAVSKEDVNKAISEYFEENPVRTSAEDIKSAVSSYMAENPASSGNVFKTVLDYGADPTGQSDSSDAFQRYADESPTSFIIPNGRFLINKTVDFGNKRPLVRGLSMNHFGGSGKGTLIAGRELGDKPVLKGVYWIENVSIKGEDNRSIGIQLNSYEAKVIGCSITGFDVGIQCGNVSPDFPAKEKGAVHCVFRDNILVGNRAAIYAEGVSTINYFENNTAQYCDVVFDFKSECYGHTYISNTFERIKGIPVMGNILYNATFINNWWEHTQTWDEDDNLVRFRAVGTYLNQQMMKCFATGNSTSVGFIDVFSGETGTHAGNMGGVSTDQNQIVVRKSVGRALRITDSSIIQELDDYSPSPDMVIRSGHALKKQKASKMIMETGKGMPLYMYTYLKKDGDIEHWPARGINMYRGTKSDGESERFNKVEQSSEFGLTVNSEAQRRNGEDYTVRNSTVTPIKWTASGEGSENLEIFKTAEVSEEGTVVLNSDGQVNFRHPVIGVSVMDRGIYLDGFDYIERYSSKNGCRGFVLYFTDRQGNPATPKEFDMYITTT